jgi:hypothetical protein
MCSFRAAYILASQHDADGTHDASYLNQVPRSKLRRHPRDYAPNLSVLRRGQLSVQLVANEVNIKMEA